MIDGRFRSGRPRTDWPRCFATNFHSRADTVAAVFAAASGCERKRPSHWLADSEFGRKSPPLGTYAAGILATPRRFSAAQTSFHSVCALASPRMLNCRNPRLLFIQRLGGSDSHLRLRWASWVATELNFPAMAAHEYRFEASIAMAFLPSRQRAAINFAGWSCGAVARNIQVLDDGDRS